MLLENSRISDSEIANKLKISSQAVGKIRRKLETTIIDSYTLNLNYAKLGISTFAIGMSKITSDGLDKGELEIEQKLLEDPHIISVYRLPSGSATHIILYGFRDMDELDSFFHSPKKKQALHNYIDSKELFTFSHNSLIKHDPHQLFHKIIDELGSEQLDNSKFDEIKRFKRRL